MDFSILECRRFIAPGTKRKIKRTVKNHEIDFYLSGSREIYINGRKNIITGNTVCIRFPGQTVYSFGDYDCYLLTLDFSLLTPTKNYVRNTAQQIEPRCDSDLLNDLPDSFIPRHSIDLRSLFSLLSEQSALNSEESKLLAREILLLLNADNLHNCFDKTGKTMTPSDLAVKFMHKYFKENLSLDTIADHVRLEKSYFSRIFKRDLGVAPIEYLINYRLNYAQALLANTDMPIKRVADECGYNNIAFFITSFKKRFGLSPKAYRINVHQATTP